MVVGWVNVDRQPNVYLAHVSALWRVLSRIGVLSSAQALALLRECMRVLRPRGVVRIVTPDLAEIITAYGGDDATQFAEAGFVSRDIGEGDAPDLAEIETRTGLVIEAWRP